VNLCRPCHIRQPFAATRCNNLFLSFQRSFSAVVAVRCSVLQCVAACCSTLQCVAVCCSALQCVTVKLSESEWEKNENPKRIMGHDKGKPLDPLDIRNALRHTATHCITLQQTATHCRNAKRAVITSVLSFIDQALTSTRCNTLQSTATHCKNTKSDRNFCMSCIWQALTVTHCNALQHTATHYNTLRDTANLIHRLHLLETLAFTATLCNTLQHNVTHCNTLQICITGYIGWKN